MFDPTPRPVSWTGISLALRSGLDESPMGSLLRVDQLRQSMAFHMNKDSGYSVWEDRQIFDAGMSDQMLLFTGSQSRDMTRWMIERFREKARIGDYIEGMGPAGTVAKFAGGILGDPLTYTPATLGLKSTQLAAKFASGTLNGAELSLLTAKSVFWGSVADTLANVESHRRRPHRQPPGPEHGRPGNRARRRARQPLPAGGAERLGPVRDLGLRPLDGARPEERGAEPGFPARPCAFGGALRAR